MTLPTLTVLLDDGTGTFPFDISSKVLAADGYEITRGRDDWQGAVTAGELTLTLNNSDGRFTPGSTILATPSPIKVDQRIRVKETVNGVTYTRFTGYAKSWPVSWSAVVPTFAEVQLSATDAQARAERRPLRSMLEEEILSDGPTAYYRLSEPEGSTSAGDISGKQAPPLTFAGTGSPVVFGNGTGPGTDGLTAAQLAGGQYLDAGTAAGALTSNTGGSVECWVNIASPPASTMGILTVRASDGSGSYLLTVNTSGQVTFPGVTGPNIADGLTHQIVATNDGATGSLYVDGVSVGTTAEGSAPVCNQLQVGNVMFSIPLTGTVSHVATYPTALSAARALAHYQVGKGLIESGTARLTRLAGYAGLTVGTFDASLTNVPSDALTGKSAQEALQEVADAEAGLVYIDGNGALTFHNRSRAWSKTTPDLTLSSQYVTPDVTPVLDDQRIVNYVEATAAGTGSMSLANSATSETAHGRYPEPHDYLVVTDQEALDRANWIVTKFAEPTPRYGTLTINLYAMTPAQASSVLAALDLDCWLRVTMLASQNPGGTVADVIVQGWQEQVSPESTTNPWTITCNVVARSLFTTLILDDATFGALDSYPLGY